MRRARVEKPLIGGGRGLVNPGDFDRAKQVEERGGGSRVLGYLLRRKRVRDKIAAVAEGAPSQ